MSGKASATSLTGAAGEPFAMSELLKRNTIAALACLVTDEIGDQLCADQVKTRNSRGKDAGWHMRKKMCHFV